jgi:hypothetical protein
MSDDTSAFGFGKFVPGFDFLQNLAKGTAQGMPQMPNMPSGLGHWVAPTLNVEDLEKRIGELKSVLFWLEQNTTALKATVQALEVQKMTLVTLKGMNFSMGDVAAAFQIKPAAVQETAPPPASKPASGPSSAPASATAAPPPAAPGVVDPMQWWGALSEQFQQIAANALKDVTAAATPPAAAATFTQTARATAARTPPGASDRPAKKPASKAAAKASAKRAPARKPPSR